MAFDVEGARKAGYSDAEIADFLGSQRKFDVGQARKAGYSDGEILGHLLTGGAPEKSAAERAGAAIREVPRQVGLTARYALEGLPGTVDAFAAPIKAATDAVYGAVTGQPGFRSRTMSETGGAVANAAGLPTPQGANERVIGDATRIGFSAAGGVGAGRAVAAAAGDAMPVVQRVAQTFSSVPGQQIAAGASAGAAGGAVREDGGSPLEQFVASLVGGIAGGAAVPVAAQKGAQFGQWARAKFGPPPPPQQVDLAIELALRNQGVDWRALTSDVRSSLRAEVADALKTGGTLNPETVRRLADFRTVGATPTRGTVTLDPIQVTREKNLAKTGANSTDVGMQQLARVENANNQSLIDASNRLGAGTAVDRTAAGDRVIGTVRSNLGAAESRVDELYAAAKDSAGRSMPMNAQQFTTRANDLLDQQLVGGFLPGSIRDRINAIAKGEAPFRVSDAVQLRKSLSTISRNSSDGNVRSAVSQVMRALDDTDVIPMGQQSGPANVVSPTVSPNGAPYVAGSTQAGEESVTAFARARAAHRALRERVEATPAAGAVESGVMPDNFMREFVLGGTEKAAGGNVRALRDFVANDPSTVQVIRDQIAAHLKEKALGGARDEVGKFSAKSYNDALRSIGDQKLALFFSPEEIAQIKAIGRVADYTLFRPSGAAVNESNSATTAAGNALDFLDKLAGKMPIGENTIRGLVRGVQQSGAMNTTPALVTQPITTPLRDLVRSSQAPGVVGAGLFSLPGVPRSEDERRR